MIPLLMFLAVCLALMLGYPVAFTLGGVALAFAGAGVLLGGFDPTLLNALPNRLYGIMENQTLLAVPLFVLMGVTLEKSKVAENLLNAMSRLFGRFPGGLGLSVTLVGMLLAASTGIVGATVVTMGLLALPTMIKRGYDPALATGSIAATGTLGQIIPPSIALVLLGDVLSNAYQQAQLNMGIFNADTVSVGDLFVGALIPGLIMVALYMAYIVTRAIIDPTCAPPVEDDSADQPPLLKQCVQGLAPPLLLIAAVLGSILAGLATPTEAAAVGALGACLLALLQNQLNRRNLQEIMISTTKVTCMVFAILIGATLFSLVFRGFNGEELIHEFFNNMPGGVFSAMLLVMVVIFLLGFILDFIEITFVVVPIVGPVLLAMGIDPVWFGVMIAVNLQTSFLTPPFGFALFYLRGVTPDSIPTTTIYRGVAPFILIQIVTLSLIAIWPSLATWLPDIVYNS
ncbi:TRAP transporter large permease [Ketobacter alkanivorans]|uniref:TRAP transporter large permease protein n=1 Tax=Ketobacter alkanivorans TaxID=1917421 RepID=A0A2K9LLR5_9GAMM|nr:TRAP transporter large permease subunit [Ketobacter alkanivorans]AUM13203.1 C4-dicarboxylate ABC transporter [Ketobacter alkanivorans]MCP5016741.1 TRAP transporter large permease subunit [Ketobacter sp.]